MSAKYVIMIIHYYDGTVKRWRVKASQAHMIGDGLEHDSNVHHTEIIEEDD